MTNSLNRDMWEGDERFSAVGMRISGRIRQLKRIDRVVIEKIVSEEINSELEKVRQEAKAEERKRCLEALPKKTYSALIDGIPAADAYDDGHNQAIDQAISAITNLTKTK